MTDEAKQLVYKLRNDMLAFKDGRILFGYDLDTLYQAADTIEHLSAELDAVEHDIREYLQNILMNKSQGHYACYICKRWEDPYTGKRYTEKRQKCPQDCNGANKWKWRGLCAENGGSET